MSNKITEREIYTSIINGNADPDVLVEFATRKIAQLNKRNEIAKRRAEVKRAEGNEVTEGIYKVLTHEPMTRTEVAVAYNGGELSPAKVGARLNALVKSGRVSKMTIKVAGEDGKQSNKVAYFVEE